MPASAPVEKDIVEGAEAPSTNAADVVMMRRDEIAKLMSGAADQAVAKYRAQEAAAGPAKVMQAKVSDGFIKSDRRTSDPILKRYRLDGVAATKIMELNMERLRYYEANPDELPMDREGFPYTPRAMALMKNKFINVIGGRITARSQNQVDQLEWMKTLPEDEGRLNGLYEVTEEVDLWQCNTCQPPMPFRNKADWAAHREAVHGIPREDAA